MDKENSRPQTGIIRRHHQHTLPNSPQHSHSSANLTPQTRKQYHDHYMRFLIATNADYFRAKSTHSLMQCSLAPKADLINCVWKLLRQLVPPSIGRTSSESKRSTTNRRICNITSPPLIASRPTIHSTPTTSSPMTNHLGIRESMINLRIRGSSSTILLELSPATDSEKDWILRLLRKTKCLASWILRTK